jgi:hypothetical protein
MPYLVTLEVMQQQCRDGRARSQSYGTARETDVTHWTRPSYLTPNLLPYLHKSPGTIPT